MKGTAEIISIYAADTSGVCSALYELGGMTVVHDASGCNSTYSTHDEPRWYDTDSMIYISGLSEIEAIMGDDDKLMSDILKTARELKPEFVALCGSPMPAMTGTDFEAIAAEVQSKSGIPSFAVDTNGMHSYLAGASGAFLKLTEKFVKKREKIKNGVNILGATPLDFSLNGSVDSIKEWLCEEGFSLVSCFAMGSSFSDIKQAAGAEVSLVVSYSGLAAARELEQKFSVPYVVGVPLGKEFPKILAQEMRNAEKSGVSSFPCSRRAAENGDFLIVGESVFSGSLANALMSEYRIKAAVDCALESDEKIIGNNDISVPSEDDIREAFSSAEAVVADPMYRPVCGENVRFYSLPHEAFSGRCYLKSLPNLINKKLDKI